MDLTDRPNRRAVLAGISALCLAPAAAAQDISGRRIAKTPDYRIFKAPPPTHHLSRFDITLDGQGYRLFLARPAGLPPAGGWPSLWMLDGNAVFDRLTPDDLHGHAGLAVIGVGYPVARIFDTTARALDYTPPGLTPDPEGNRGRRTGGAAAFRARLTGGLRHAVEAQVGLDPARRVLWGHSYGGLFTLHCLLSAPGAFAGWVPVSPSSGFGGGVLRHMLADAPPVPDGRVAPLRIMLGDREHRSGTEAPAEPRPSPKTVALADLLARRGDLDVGMTVFEGLGHGQTFSASFGPAMDLALGI